MNQFVEIAKKIPGLRPLAVKLREIIYWTRYQSILTKLHPISTDKELIRFGPTGDGGYLIPNDLDGISACFSPGVSSISGFEKDCANQGMKVFLADASVTAPSESDPLFQFSKKFIGGYARENFITLQQWIDESAEKDDADYMMQMDIEGFEYEALEAASPDLINQFRIIVIEFHELQHFSKEKLRIFKKLLTSHYCVHIHPNNCMPAVNILGLDVPPVMEFTLLRKDRVSNYLNRNDFPHKLDSENTEKAPLPLPPCWYVQKNT